MALARVHRRLDVGDGAHIALPAIDALPVDGVGLLVGAGFLVDGDTAVRARSLPDTVAPRMRVLGCGLYPCLYAPVRGAGRDGREYRSRRAGLRVRWAHRLVSFERSTALIIASVTSRPFRSQRCSSAVARADL